MDSLFDELPAPGIFLNLGLFGRAKWMMEPSTAHNPIGPDTRRHRIQAGRQGGWNAHTLTLFGDRSPATRPRASCGWQHDGLDASLHQRRSNLRTNALHGIQAADIAHRDEHFVEQLPNDACA